MSTTGSREYSRGVLGSTRGAPLREYCCYELHPKPTCSPSNSVSTEMAYLRLIHAHGAPTINRVSTRGVLGSTRWRTCGSYMRTARLFIALRTRARACVCVCMGARVCACVQVRVHASSEGTGFRWITCGIVGSSNRTRAILQSRPRRPHASAQVGTALISGNDDKRE
jgi:hypothetical protein